MRNRIKTHYMSSSLLEFYNKCNSSTDGKFCDTAGGNEKGKSVRERAKDSKASKNILSTEKNGVVKVKPGTSTPVATSSKYDKATPAELKAAVARKIAAKTKPEPKPEPKPKPEPAKKVTVDKKVAEKMSGGGGGDSGVSAAAMGQVVKGSYKGDPHIGLMKVLEANGWTGSKPTKVSKAEFDKLDQANVLARTAPASANKDFVNGDKHKLMKGSDEHGEGSYFARGRNAAEHVEDIYGRPGHTTLMAHMSVKGLPTGQDISRIAAIAARVVESDSFTIEKGMNMWGRDVVPKSAIPQIEKLVEIYKQSGVKDPSGWEATSDWGYTAALLGIKAYRVPEGGYDHDDQYVVVLDRSVLTVAG